MDLLTPPLGLFIWNLVAFIVLFFILTKFAWKPILKSLNERESSIADSIAMADKIKAEMALMKNENEAMMAKAREERGQMLKEAKETSDKIVSAAKEQAKAEANKIMADASLAIQNQKMAALTDVKNQVGKLVVEVSEKVLRRELADKVGQETFIRQLAGEVKLN